MYVTDQWTGRIRKITSAGVVTTITGQSSCFQSGIAGERQRPVGRHA
jgi:hypothetical protein